MNDHQPICGENITNPIRIIVFGGTGVGKTSLINDASQSELEAGHDLQSCTKEMQTSQVFYIDGRSIQLFDTPGFDDTKLNDTEVLLNIGSILLNMQIENQPFTGFLYIHRITDNRISGAPTRAFSLFERICGKGAMGNAVIVTNMWSLPRDPEEATREEQLKEDLFKTAIENGARVARRGRTGLQSALGIIRMLLNHPPVPLGIQLDLLPSPHSLSNTAAGIYVGWSLRRRTRLLEEELKELLEEAEQAVMEGDVRAEKQLERFISEKREQIGVLQQQHELLNSAQLILPSNHRLATSNQVSGRSSSGVVAQGENKQWLGFHRRRRRNRPESQQRRVEFS